MNVRRSLIFAIKLTIICFALGSFYFLYNYTAYKGMGKNQHPLPSTYQLDVLFKTIASHSGDQEAIINIMEDGKYSLPEENFTFDYQVKPRSFSEALNRVKSYISKRTSKENKKTQWDGYLRVYLFGEELSKQMRVFMGIGNFPGFKKMKIVAPSFANGQSLSKGPTSFQDVYNLDELNQAFAQNGYSPVVLNKEYDDVCKDVKTIYVITFIPPRSTPKYIGYTDSIRDQLYGKNIKPGMKDPERWIDCDFNKNALRPLSVDLTKRKMICITYRFDISTLRETVLKDAKCFEVPIWSDHGMYKRPSGPDNLSPDEIFLFLLNPSDMIVNEVNAFTERFLEKPYVAIHIRAGHIDVRPTTTDRCFNLAMRVVQALKKKRGVKSIYISTDMNKFGGLGVNDPGHEEYFAAISGAVRYKPNATGLLGDISRTSISITNVLLLRRSDHLIAIGTGSFHEFVMGQFLREHFGNDPKTWSLIRMCENARGGKIKEAKNVDYSEYMDD